MRDVLDRIIMGQLQALVYKDKMTQITESQNTEHVLLSAQFCFGGIVYDTFSFLHTISC